MGEATKIEWADHTLSPWHGCSKVPGHPGCDNCYAERMSKRNPAVLGIWGDNGTRVPAKKFAEKLRKLNDKAAARGVIETVFPSICDPFEDRPELVPWRQEMFQAADECHNIVLILLTKRPPNVRQMWPDNPLIEVMPDGKPGYLHDPDCQSYCDYACGGLEDPPSVKFRRNVWILTSVSDQATADKMVPELLKLRDLVPVLGLSIEPLLGPIDLTRLDNGAGETFDALRNQITIRRRGEKPHTFETSDCGKLNWIIVGGESGPNARPMHPDWVRSLRDQAVEAGVPFFFKQHGEWCEFRDIPDEWLRTNEIESFPSVVIGEHSVHRIGKAVAGRTLDGRTWDEFPEMKGP